MLAQIDDSGFEHKRRNMNVFMRLELESHTLDRLDDINGVAIIVSDLICINTSEFCLRAIGALPHD